jgi:hypothetical protein
MDTALLEVLRAVKKEPVSLRGGDGSAIVVLPYGGRVLGLFAAGDATNFLWTNPALAKADTAQAFYDSGEWANSGGDRTWLAPEIDFFLPEYPKLTSYFQPRALDPGSYRVDAANSEIRLAMDFSVTAKRSGVPANLRLNKTIRSTPDPLSAQGIRYAGYEVRTELEAVGSLPSRIGIWKLLQLPHAGELIIPTYLACRPLVVFGNPPPEHLKTSKSELRYRMSAMGDHKISIPASYPTGRMGYFHESDGTSHLIVRNFFVNPSGDYIDASWNDPLDTGYAVQACNVNGKYGTFSEMEYHVPAMSPARPRSVDVSQVWAYRGSRAQIEEIARRLLGSTL